MLPSLPWLMAVALAVAPPPTLEPMRAAWAPPMGPPVVTAPPNAVLQTTGIADPLTEPEAKVTHGMFSPDGKRIAVAVDRGGVRHIELRDWTGSVPPLALTSGEGIDDFPCWTPDGDALVYQSTRANSTKLYMLTMAQRREVAITFGSGDDYHPRVSHSGRYIAFDSNRSGNSDIWLLDRETGKLGQVTEDPGADFYPCWSPDDRAIAFTSGRSGRFEIWAQHLGKGRQAVRITYGPGHQAHPDWAPSGWIAYDSDQAGQTRVLMIQPQAAIRAAAAHQGVSIDSLVQASGAIVAVTDGLSNEEFPRFSRVGRHVLVQVTDGRFTSLRIRRSPVSVPAETLAMVPAAPALAAAPAPSGRRLIVHDGSRAPALVPGGVNLGVPPVQGLPVGAGVGLPLGSLPDSGDPSAVPPRISSVGGAGTQPGSGAPGPGGPPPGATPDALQVLDVFPRDEPQGVPLDTPIAVVFNRGLDRVMEPEKAVDLLDGTEKLEVVGSYNPGLRRLDLVPKSALTPGTEYAVVVHGTIRSQEGSPLGNDVTHRFRTAGASGHAKLSADEFRTATVVPGRNQHGIAQNVKLEVRFTQKLNLNSLSEDAIRLTDEDGRAIPGEIFAPPGDMSVTLKPYKPLAEGRTYRVALGAKVRSEGGKPVPEDERDWEFRTVSHRPFAVLTAGPAVLDGPRPRVRVRFTRPVDLRTVARGRMTLEGGGESFGGRVTNDAGGEVLIFEPYQSLPAGQLFTIGLPPGITDDEGHELRTPPRLTVKTRPGRPTTLLPHDAPTPPILGLGRAQGSSAAAPRVLTAHGMPQPGAPIITQYFGARQTPAAPPPPGAKPGPAWVYSALRDFARRGFLGEDADVNKIGAQMTRWKLAQLVNQAGRGFANMDLTDRQMVRRLQKEFSGELASQGFDTQPRL